MSPNGYATSEATHWAEEDPFVSGEVDAPSEYDAREDEGPSPWAAGGEETAYAEESEPAGRYAEGELDADDAASAERESVETASNECESAVDFSPRTEVDSELFERLIPFGPAVEKVFLAHQVSKGLRDPNALTDYAFFRRHPELKGTRLGPGQQALAAEWRQIRDQIVQPMLARLGSGAPPPAPSGLGPAVPAPAARSGDPSRQLLYDGSTPAPGTTETRRAFPISPPVRGDPSNRNRMLYDNVINQFAVEVNPRYAQKRDETGKIKSTYCNIFCWDVTCAMGAEVPHWVTPSGDPVERGKGNEMNANATFDWLQSHGGRFGWRLVVDLNEAQALANRGHPTIASMKKPGGIGHVAVIRPGEVTAKGPTMAQAGRTNSNRTALYAVFGRSSSAELWTNDGGTAT